MKLEQLFANNWQFANATANAGGLKHDPALVTVSCCDARVPQDTVFGTPPGDNFTVANIGNSVVTRDATGAEILAGSVLYPIEKTNPECVIIVGHTDCGAVTAAYGQAAEGASEESDELQNELDLLVPIVEEGLALLDDGLDRDQEITRMVEYNVDRQVERLVDHGSEIPILGVVCDLHGYYDGKPGQCHLINDQGSRQKSDVRESIRSNFQRKLVY